MAVPDRLPEPSTTDAAGVAEPTEDQATRRSRLALAAFLCGGGLMHFVVPWLYDRIIPRWIPGKPRHWTYGSGVAEIASGALVAIPRTRRIGAALATATLVGVYPANVQMAIDTPPTTPVGIGIWLRLPLQFPMIAWALRHTRT